MGQHDSRPTGQRCRSLVLRCATLIVALALSPAAGAAEEPSRYWQQSVKVSRPTGEDQVLKAAFHHVVRAGIPEVFAARAIGGLDRHVQVRTLQGKTTTLLLGLVIDSVASAHAAGWSADEASLLLIALHEDLSSSNYATTNAHRIIAAVDAGRSWEEVRAGLLLAR